jgi:hypothetical protein
VMIRFSNSSIDFIDHFVIVPPPFSGCSLPLVISLKLTTNGRKT